MYLILATHRREKSIHRVWRGMLRLIKSIHVVSKAVISLGFPPSSLLRLLYLFLLSSKLLINEGPELNSLSSSIFYLDSFGNFIQVYNFKYHKEATTSRFYL